MDEELRTQGLAPRDALAQEVERAITAVFDTALSAAELVMPTPQYTKYRSRVLGKGNQEIRHLRGLLDRQFAVQYVDRIIFGPSDDE